MQWRKRATSVHFLPRQSCSGADLLQSLEANYPLGLPSPHLGGGSALQWPGDRLVWERGLPGHAGHVKGNRHRGWGPTPTESPHSRTPGSSKLSRASVVTAPSRPPSQLSLRPPNVRVPFSGPAPTGATAQAPGAAAVRTPGPTFWEKECTTPPGRTSNATVVGSDTASAGLNAAAASSNAAHKLAPPPFLLSLGAAILGSGPQGWGGDGTPRGTRGASARGHVGGVAAT